MKRQPPLEDRFAVVVVEGYPHVDGGRYQVEIDVVDTAYMGTVVDCTVLTTYARRSETFELRRYSALVTAQREAARRNADDRAHVSSAS